MTRGGKVKSSKKGFDKIEKRVERFIKTKVVYKADQKADFLG